MKSSIPALVCLAGMLYYSWKLHRYRPVPKPNYTIEITVHAPDGSTIPIISHR